MLETLKKVLLDTFATWSSKIDQNGFHDINMATEFSDILTRNILHICFGEDIADDELLLQVKDAQNQWVTKSISVKDCIYIIVGQVTDRYLKNCSHPVNWLYPHTRTLITVDKDAQRVEDNCQVVRNWVKKYI